MKKDYPLSMSAAQNYWECPAKYQNQYLKRLYPEFDMSYFIYGRAIDLALNSLLLGKDDYKKVCVNTLKELLVKKIEFIPNDYDGEIISEEVREEILKKCQDLGFKGDDIDGLVKSLFSKPVKELSESQRQCLAICCYESLKVKARLTIISFKKNVLPKITNISDVQKELNWSDKHGTYKGVLDFRCSIAGEKYLADNKTASNPFRDYPPGCVEDSLQFALYAAQTGDKQACYFVFNKAVKKNREKICKSCGYNGSGGKHKTCDQLVNDARCHGEWEESIVPEIECTIRVGTISDESKAFSQEALGLVKQAIKTNVFPKNLKACKKIYGDKEVLCQYYNYCRTGSKEGLK